jgi:hypothetical protein
MVDGTMGLYGTTVDPMREISQNSWPVIPSLTEQILSCAQASSLHNKNKNNETILYKREINTWAIDSVIDRSLPRNRRFFLDSSTHLKGHLFG